MPRHEFSAKVKRAALERSGGQCEAIGAVYGLPSSMRCTKPVKKGSVQFDHWPLPAHADDCTGLENCVACCFECHAWKTGHFDVPAEAKIKRRRQKHGLDPVKRKPRPKMRSNPNIPSRPFPKRQGK